MIQLRGPFAYAWVLWHAARLFGLMWVVRLGWPVSVDTYFAILYTAFLPLEIAGAATIRRDPPGVELVRTLSQSNQWIAQQGRFGQHVAMLSGALDVALLFKLLEPHGLLVAGTASFGLAWRLMGHYAFRKDEG
ncbi:MAG: hypothetical protein AB7Q29_15985 [Vicinamibacterales bacterium]